MQALSQLSYGPLQRGVLANEGDVKGFMAGIQAKKAASGQKRRMARVYGGGGGAVGRGLTVAGAVVAV